MAGGIEDGDSHDHDHSHDHSHDSHDDSHGGDSGAGPALALTFVTTAALVLGAAVTLYASYRVERGDAAGKAPDAVALEALETNGGGSGGSGDRPDGSGGSDGHDGKRDGHDGIQDGQDGIQDGIHDTSSVPNGTALQHQLKPKFLAATLGFASGAMAVTALSQLGPHATKDLRAALPKDASEAAAPALALAYGIAGALVVLAMDAIAAFIVRRRKVAASCDTDGGSKGCCADGGASAWPMLLAVSLHKLPGA